LSLAASSAPNVHSVSAGSSTPKNVSASLIACATAPGNRSSSKAAARVDSRPLTAFMKIARAPACGRRSRTLERRLDLREEGFETGHRDQRRLQQHERMHVLGMVERHLRGDRRAARVARDVDGAQTEMVEYGRGVGGVVRDAHGRRVWVLPTEPRLWYRMSW